jgi:hypothetical protein
LTDNGRDEHRESATADHSQGWPDQPDAGHPPRHDCDIRCYGTRTRDSGCRHAVLNPRSARVAVLEKPKRARMDAMRYVLAKSYYDDKDTELVGEPDPLIVGRALTD